MVVNFDASEHVENVEIIWLQISMFPNILMTAKHGKFIAKQFNVSKHVENVEIIWLQISMLPNILMTLPNIENLSLNNLMFPNMSKMWK